jgi:hypothetical protein
LAADAGEGLSVSEGEFSIIDWSGYPEGPAPRPTGPFRILTGEEYEIARSTANRINTTLHRSYPSLQGLAIHEIHPVKFGGSPVDLSNKIALITADHARYTTWWNNILRLLSR